MESIENRKEIIEMEVQNLVDRIKFKIYRMFHRKFSIHTIKQKTKRIFLFGTVEHMNYGDIAINIAEHEFFNKYFVGYELIEVPERFTYDAIKKIKKIISKSDIVCYHGGGNMGDIWEDQEPLRRQVFKTFHDNIVVSMPQSTSYKDYSDSGNLRQDTKLMALDSNLTLFARDYNSFNVMRKEFPHNVNIELVPDMVLSLNRVKTIDKIVDVTAFLRKDREKASNVQMLNVINLLKRDYSIVFSDTVDEHVRIVNERSRDRLLENKLNEFRKSKLIITDRLHGMIFAVITGTPAVVFDNNNHKIKYSYVNWLRDIPYIIFAEDFNENQLLEKVRLILDKRNGIKATLPNFEIDFKNMAMYIKTKAHNLKKADNL